MNDVERIVRNYITGTLGRNLDGVDDAASLLELGLIDSLAVISIVEFVGERFAIVVTEDDMVPEHFDSISAIAQFVNGRTAGAGA